MDVGEKDEPETAVELASKEDRTLIAGMMQRYLEELAPHTGQKAQGNGRYRYPFLDSYWLEEERHPFLMKSGRHNVGFVLVRDVRGGHELAEFYVAPAHRRLGHGRRAAHIVFALFPGRWVVRQALTNSAAQTFWRTVIRDVDTKYGERIETSKDGRSFTVQKFAV